MNVFMIDAPSYARGSSEALNDFFDHDPAFGNGGAVRRDRATDPDEIADAARGVIAAGIAVERRLNLPVSASEPVDAVIVDRAGARLL